eukprot:7914092-Pyramimonas_sp.AAC.1
MTNVVTRLAAPLSVPMRGARSPADRWKEVAVREKILLEGAGRCKPRARNVARRRPSGGPNRASEPRSRTAARPMTKCPGGGSRAQPRKSKRFMLRMRGVSLAKTA